MRSIWIPDRTSASRTESKLTLRRGAPNTTSANDPAAVPTASIIKLRTGTSVAESTCATMAKTTNTQPVRRHDRIIHGPAVTSHAVNIAK